MEELMNMSGNRMACMVYIICAVIVILLAALFFVAYFYRRNMRRLMNSLSNMLDLAIDGEFTEHTFDESLMSSVEAKLAHFLSSCAVSSKNLTAEKETIQSLISDISHQTKTPVANILLYSQLLREQQLSDESEICVKALSEQAEKLDFLMVALVKASRLESGIITINPKRKPISELLNHILCQIQPKADAKEITIKTNVTDSLAYYDPKWTVEAVYNIFDNAVKYSYDKSTITINAVAYEMFYRIDITDQGIGIQEDEREKIFTRFYRSERVNGYEGVGLGLYLSREIITGGGGYIKVAGLVGAGTTFSVFLPMERR